MLFYCCELYKIHCSWYINVKYQYIQYILVFTFELCIILNINRNDKTLDCSVIALKVKNLNIAIRCWWRDKYCWYMYRVISSSRNICSVLRNTCLNRNKHCFKVTKHANDDQIVLLTVVRFETGSLIVGLAIHHSIFATTGLSFITLSILIVWSNVLRYSLRPFIHWASYLYALLCDE